MNQSDQMTSTLMERASRLAIVSGPSGAGKSTVVKALLERCHLPIEVSVSATTRPPREGEVDGVDYFFLSHEEFEQRRQRGEFLECMEVFGQGDWYGTLTSSVATGLAAGKIMLLEIDVKGAMEVLRQTPNAISFFVHPGSTEELEKRLRGRSTESDEQIKVRLQRSEEEMEFSDHYTRIIVNHVAEDAADEICELLMLAEKRNPCTKS